MNDIRKIIKVNWAAKNPNEPPLTETEIDNLVDAMWASHSNTEGRALMAKIAQHLSQPITFGRHLFPNRR